jgi:hypothetical protein
MAVMTDVRNVSDGFDIFCVLSLMAVVTLSMKALMRV